MKAVDQFKDQRGEDDDENEDHNGACADCAGSSGSARRVLLADRGSPSRSTREIPVCVRWAGRCVHGHAAARRAAVRQKDAPYGSERSIESDQVCFKTMWKTILPTSRQRSKIFSSSS